MRAVALAFLVAFVGLVPSGLVPARAAEPIASEPYRTDFGGWFTISATVNGEGPYEFIIDTGTTHTLVFKNLAEKKNFSPVQARQQRVLSVGASGYYPTYKIGDIAIGDARIDNVVSVVLDDWTVNDRAPAGILGLDFLTRYTIVFDAATRLATFYEKGVKLDGAENWGSIDLRREKFGFEGGELLTLTGMLDRRRVEFMLDLGAAGTIINDAALGRVIRRGHAKSFFDAADPVAGRIVGALDESGKTRGVRVNNFKVGGLSWRRKIFLVYNAPIFAEVGRAKTPFGLFGADMVRNRSFALDVANNRFLIGPAANRSAAVKAQSLLWNEWSGIEASLGH